VSDPSFGLLRVERHAHRQAAVLLHGEDGSIAVKAAAKVAAISNAINEPPLHANERGTAARGAGSGPFRVNRVLGTVRTGTLGSSYRCELDVASAARMCCRSHLSVFAIIPSSIDAKCDMAATTHDNRNVGGFRA
jgi:hypothetical protein